MAFDSPSGVDDDALLGLASSTDGGSAPDSMASGTRDAEATIDLSDRAGEGPDSSALGWPMGSTIAGRYEVRNILGEGGMGIVYRAEQIQPIRRAVALKLIRSGSDTRGVLARFQGERQALALMDHPHIARVLDGGTTEFGDPFFVMDLVEGLPLTAYCDQHQLSLPARLRLFAEVCLAVQHAHQKGIIHRDLKPSNILVEHRDGQSRPKVIDFGLAKAVDGVPLKDSGLLTAFGAVAGTPLYMAPEQAACASDIDTRADIYALGVILYELLTGSTPIRRESLRRVTFDELLRLVREEEPPTPSRRISSLDALPSLAAQRQVEASRLGRLLRGELDWIVMKTLAKERERRYDSAAALAQDLGRHLRHEAVLAGPPSASYHARKFVRRHWGQVVAALLVVLALVGGIVGTTLGLWEARRRSTQNEKIGEILGSIFRDLDPRHLDQPGTPLRALIGAKLDHAAEQIEGESIGDPVAVARMQLILAESQANLGYPDKAAALLTKCQATLAARLGSDDPLTLASLDKLGMNQVDAGHLDRGIALLSDALARRRRVLGPGHADTIDTLGNLAYAHQNARQPERAIPLFEEALGLTRAYLGPGHQFELICLSNLAACYLVLDRTTEALALNEQALPLIRAKLGRDHPDTLNAMAGLASAYRAAGQHDRAIRLFKEALDLMQARLGPDHPETAVLQGNLALTFKAAGQADQAVPLLERALAVQEARLGPDHPDTLQVLMHLAEAQRLRGDRVQAIMLERQLEGAHRRLRPGSPEHTTSLATLGTDLVEAERWVEAEAVLREALTYREAREANAWTTANARSLLGAALLGQGRRDEARPLLVAGFAGLKGFRGDLPPPRDRLVAAVDQLIRLAQASGHPDEVHSWEEEKGRLLTRPEATPPGKR